MSYSRGHKDTRSVAESAGLDAFAVVAELESSSWHG